jgi:dihydroflavonol-4-reductase
MKIFITGATGFIGNHLLGLLSETEHELRCLARKTSDVHPLEKVGADIIIGDVKDKDSLLEGMKGCDWAVHMASSFVFWVPDNCVYSDVNIQGTQNVMESALETGISKIVSVSSVGIWGNAALPVSEETPYGSERYSKYLKTKYEGDLITWQLYKDRKLPVVMIYPSAVVGPNDPKATGRYIKNFALGRMPAQVLTRASFPFIYVKDICAAILKALEKEGNIGEKYIVSSANLTFGEVNKMISEISGKKLPFIKLPKWLTTFNSYILTGVANLIRRPPLWDMSVDQISLMKRGFEFDGSKTERELGFKYTPIREAFEEAIASFQK